jgi:hypothetical protein
MRLPRWLIVSLLTVSALAVLSTGMWWWVTWPERTAREFVELVRLAQFDEAERVAPFLRGPGSTFARDELLVHRPRARINQSRSLSDIILGRLRFKFLYGEDLAEGYFTYGYEVERGAVVRLPLIRDM